VRDNTSRISPCVPSCANPSRQGHAAINSLVGSVEGPPWSETPIDYKPHSKKVCYKCGKPGHFISKCPLSSDSDRGDDKKERKKEKKKNYKKKGGDAHVCREWDSDESSTDSSSDEEATNIVVTKGLLFPNVGHKCLMAKDGKKKKVKFRASTKYTTSSDEGSSSDDEDDFLALLPT
jgi:hypothetical protein